MCDGVVKEENRSIGLADISPTKDHVEISPSNSTHNIENIDIGPSNVSLTDKPISKKTIDSSSPKKMKIKRYPPKLIINTFNTVYDIVQEAAKKHGFEERKIEPRFQFNPHFDAKPVEVVNSNEPGKEGEKAPQADPEIFDIFWYDLAITPNVLYKMKPYQRVSQWPGIQVVAHKNKLGQNLMQMRREFPVEYDFFPETFILPYDMQQFKKQFFV